MGKEILNYKPTDVWKHFYALTQLPRPSRHEGKVIKYIQDFAIQLGLGYHIDEVGNIVVSKPATKGKENHRGVILQSHVDMVPQKNSDKVHNFETDPIETLIDGEWLKANQTTLGADNGIGCAAMLAILESTSTKHGPLEALFTINEEAGMDGAFGLKGGVLKGQVLINLDSEDEGELFIGCAGGLNVQANSSYQSVAPESGKAFEIIIKGLKGGHSGLDINLGRGNSNKIMGRLLWSALNNLSVQVASLKGGDLRNAIPREAHAIVIIPEIFVNDLKSFISRFTENLKEELKHTEPGLSIELVAVDVPSKVISPADAMRLIGVLNAAPSGAMRMSDVMPGLVETSLNLSIVRIENEEAEFTYLVRSSIDTAKYAVGEKLSALHSITGFELNFSGDYPGWSPNRESYVLKVCSDTYQKLFNKTPGLLAIHAGLECGIIGGKYHGLDMISFGPTIRSPHSPDEKVHIASVDKFYDFLKATLEAIG
ncbi:MAG: aminoacyl-histidine dipeptidase [Bacteroidota bacterium]|nr:MAG: aminoacyl-histidine dipeptidase [Bacteroidota bacterium]